MVLPSLTSLFQTTAFKRIIVALSYILLSTSLTLITKCLFSKYGFNNVTSLILAQQFFIIVSSFKCCCVSHRSVYETYSDGLCYSVFIMEFLSPIALDFRLFVPNRAFSHTCCFFQRWFASISAHKMCLWQRCQNGNLD